MQGSHNVLQMASYSQPLRGTPIESLPAAQAAAYLVDPPAVATLEAALETSGSPRTPMRCKLSARASLEAVFYDR